MGRQVKTGLDYFPFEIKFFNDIKVRKLIKYQGGRSVVIYACLLCNIYEKGYYMVWDNELPFLVSEITGFEEGYIKEVINCCFSVGLFDKNLREKSNIITSKGIQERYDTICKLSKRKNQINEFSLINSKETSIYSEEISINSEEIHINSGKSTQSKVKKSKVNNTTNCINNLYNYSFVKIDDFPELYKKFEFEKKYLFLAYKFWEMWNRENPNQKTLTDAKISKWYEAIRLIVEVDKQKPDKLIGIYCYFQKCANKEAGFDDFWFNTVKSVSAFRKKDKDEVYYLDKIISHVNNKIAKDQGFSRLVQDTIKKFNK